MSIGVVVGGRQVLPPSFPKRFPPDVWGTWSPGRPLEGPETKDEEGRTVSEVRQVHGWGGGLPSPLP